MQLSGMKIKGIAAALGLAMMLATPAFAVPVDLELVLAADVSGSLDSTDFALQRDGYAAAFNNADVVSTIESGAIGSIAVTFVYWSETAVQSVGWTLINDATTASDFATSITNAPRPGGIGNGTGMTTGLGFAAGLFADNGYEGTRNVIDVSGDGAESEVCSGSSATCAPLQAARDAFLGTGGSINALWIDDRFYFGDDDDDIINALLYGTTNVIGGPGSFQDIVQDFDGFTNGIQNKLIREIGGGGGVPEVPEPSTYLLMLGGLGMLVLRRHSRG